MRNTQRPGSPKKASRAVTGRERALRVTRQKKIEEALRESEEKFRSFIEQSSDGIVLINERGYIVEWSKGQEKLTGLSRADALGRAIWDVQFLFLTDERKTSGARTKMKSETLSVLRTGRSSMHGKENEVEIQRVDGTRRLIETVVFPIKTLTGWMVGSISRDITERKLAEGNVQALFDATTDSVMLLDADGTVLAANKVFARMLHRKPEEIIGSYAYDLIPPDLAKRRKSIIDEVIRSGKADRFEDEHNGIWFDNSIYPVFDVQGKVARLAIFAKNITERKRAEEALSQSEGKYRGLVEQSLVGIGTSQGNRVIFANPALLNMFGYDSLEEFAKIPLIDHVAPKSREHIEARMKKLTRGEQTPREFEYDIIRRDGKTRTLQASVTHVTLDNETYTESVFQDITDRKHVEEELRQSEERFRLAMEATSDGLWDFNVETGDVYYSPACARMLGYERDEFPGPTQSWMDFIHPDDRDAALRSNQDCIENRIPNFAVEFRMRTKSGEWAWILSRGHASARDANGRALRMIGTHVDITELKGAANALRESEDRLRRITDNMLDIVVETDLQGVCKYASPSNKAILGYDPKDLVGKSLFDFVHPEDLATVTATIQRAVSTGRLWTGGRFECRYRHADGHYVWLENLANIVYDEKGQMIGGVIGARDITERKRMQDEIKRYSEHLEELVKERTENLAESELRYRRLFESSPISLWEEDFSEVKRYFDDLRSRGINDLRRHFMEHPEELVRCAGMAKILDVNEATLGLYGAKTVEELRGELRRVFTHDFQDKFREELVALSEGRTRFASEFDNQTLTGDVKHVNLILSVVPGSEDTLGKVLVSIIDLTERKRMEQELRSTKERLEYVVTSNPAVIYSGKPFADLSDWELTYLSENVTNLLGYEAHEFVGHPEFWTHIVHPNDRPSVMAQMRRLWEKGRFIFEYRMRHKDGVYRMIREESNVVHDADGKPIEVNGYWTDISAQKQAELALAESERKYRQLIETAQEGLFTYDTNGVVTFVNPFMSIMLGYAPEEMIGKNLLAFVDEEDVSRVKAGMVRRRRGIAETYEVRLIRKDEARIYTNVTVSPIMGEGGEFAGGLALLSDITQRKKLEAQLAESQRLAAIGETTTMVGHDLRNPLQAMTSTLYVAKRLATSDKVEDRKEAAGLLGTLDEAIEYMDKIVSDLQDYARPVGAELVETSLPDLIRATVSGVKIQGNVDVAVNVEAGLSNVKLDPLLFRRVLTNLILNAVQAMPKGGRLTITGSREGELLTVGVQDTGVGIAPENLRKVFTPFFTTKAKGQGLGLAVCKRLTEAQGGTITVTSQVGEGSTFTLTIPTNRTPRAT